jgi:hypothetical protein
VSTSRTRDRILLGSGLVGVIGNVGAVALLLDQPAGYRLGGLDDWAQQVGTHRITTAASAIAFTLGLIGIAIWALALRDHLGSRLARTGAVVVAIGALADALGTLTPLVLALHVADTSSAALLVNRALLGFTLALDALFNLTLGLGLLAVATGLPAEVKPWLRALAFGAGLASLPVSGQLVSDAAAKWLLVAGPLWLLFIMVISFARFEPHAHRHA